MKYFALFLLVNHLMTCSVNNVRFTIDLHSKKKLTTGDTLRATVKSRKDIAIDSVHFFLDEKPVTLPLVIDKQPLGIKWLKAKIHFGKKVTELSRKITLLANSPPALYGYKIENEFPHDMEAYTQGLEFFGDTLYESTGLRGKSSLRKVDFNTGNILLKQPLADKYFGEGITIIGNRLYQLTWKAKMGFVYKRSTLELIKTFSYGKSKEGWGLCNDGKRIYKSDGSSRIWQLDTQTQKEIGSIQATTNRTTIAKINELEWINGKIYANSYQENKQIILIINPTSGQVEGVINLQGLRERVAQLKSLDVLNGIAYHPERKTIFVTGKNWNKLFEITIVKK